MKNSRPDGDVWNIVDNDSESQHFGKNFKFDFSFIESKEVKDIVKDYVWQNYKTRNMTLSKLRNSDLDRFRYFQDFASKRKIISLKTLTNNDAESFMSYLHTVLSLQRNQPLSYEYQKKCLDAVKAIIRWCQLHRPDDVPRVEIFTGKEYLGVNRKLKIDFIPDEIVCKINESLKTEKNPYLKYGIIILESTGMRIGDLMKLQIDCIKPHLINGYTITWFDHKNRRQRQPMPVGSECAMAVDKLIEITKDLRDKIEDKNKNFLFINKITSGNQHRMGNGLIDVISCDTFNWWLRCLIRDNNIMDANGEYYNLTSHHFRRTLGTDMLSKGININVIQEVLGHADASVTKRFYADVKDKERAEIFKGVGIIGNINQISMTAFDNIGEFEWFKSNQEKGACLCDGYCTKPIVEGKICDRLLKRQKCYTCSRYITTPEYLDAHKNHLESLEKQLEEGSFYGEHYAEHFIPTIEVLKVIIEKLEELQDAKS